MTTRERSDPGDGREPDLADLGVPSAESTRREVNGVTLHVVAAGDRSDPLVVFLHGFPEFWYGWREYVEPFVGAGYRVLVPDQRGYNRSEKPAGVRPYRISELSGDVADLVDTEDRDSACVVGHDWGAGVAWDLSLRHPGVVDRLGILNAPHPTVFAETLRSNPTQLRRSWYVFYFQIPRFPEWYLKRSGFAVWVDAMRDGASPGTFANEEIQRYRDAWEREGAPRAMLNWYRALLRHAEDPPRERVEAPTLVVWGEDDRALVPEMAPESVEYCVDGRLERFPDAGHWVNHERSDRIVGLLLDHFEA
jgi:pimeloyl-ACP methyl ester carboxylesterase